MEPNSRKTVNANSVVEKKDRSIHVAGSLPIIAERAMQWEAGTPLGEACHDSTRATPSLLSLNRRDLVLLLVQQHPHETASFPPSVRH